MYPQEGQNCLTNDVLGEERLPWGWGPPSPQFCQLLGTWGLRDLGPSALLTLWTWPIVFVLLISTAWSLEADSRQV